MKALFAQGSGELRVVEVETPRPGPKEVLCKVAHCGVCATDIAIKDGVLNLGEGLNPIYPVRLGHEWSGVVVETGSETRSLKKGDHVISDIVYSCGECAMCAQGKGQFCPNTRAIGTIGNCWPGAFAEYMLLPERLLIKVPDHVPLSEAALIEPATIATSGLVRAPICPENTLLVIGSGAIALGGLASAKGLGIGRTLLAGRKERKLEIGRALGADVVIPMQKEDLKSAVMRETNGLGVDVILDTTGAVDLLNQDLELLCKGGTLVIPGFYEREIPNFRMDLLTIKNCTLVGTAGTSNIGRKVLSMLANGHIKLLPMITDRYRFEDVKQAFDAVKQHNDTRVKVMVDFD